MTKLLSCISELPSTKKLDCLIQGVISGSVQQNTRLLHYLDTSLTLDFPAVLLRSGQFLPSVASGMSFRTLVETLASISFQLVLVLQVGLAGIQVKQQVSCTCLLSTVWDERIKPKETKNVHIYTSKPSSVFSTCQIYRLFLRPQTSHYSLRIMWAQVLAKCLCLRNLRELTSTFLLPHAKQFTSMLSRIWKTRSNQLRWGLEVRAGRLQTAMNGHLLEALHWQLFCSTALQPQPAGSFTPGTAGSPWAEQSMAFSARPRSAPEWKAQEEIPAQRFWTMMPAQGLLCVRPRCPQLAWKIFAGAKPLACSNTIQ